MYRRTLCRVTLTLLILIATVCIPSTTSVQAQATDPIYFPETGHTLRGSFRIFWEQNGGISIFGFPITEELVRTNDGRTVQFFERARFELIITNNQAIVILGQLGREFLGGRTFPKAQPIQDTKDKRYIPETGYIIQYGFKQIWETRGGPAIFGFPLSNEIKEITDDGVERTVQYFENFRFEYWPERPDGQRVLFSRLGSRFAPPEFTGPVPPPSQQNPPPSQPAPAPDTSVPPSVNAEVTPSIGPPGTTFRFGARGFEPGERVGVWLNAPDQSVIGADFQVTADDSGSIGYAEISIETDENYTEGVWSFVAQGTSSKRQAIGYFRIKR